MLGQLAGDALNTPEQIRSKYPHGVRELADGGTWGTIAGQPTDDSEMALILARMLVKHRRYDAEQAREAYLFWLHSGPFDCGNTVSCGLRGRHDLESQANGAMMRISPLGIFGTNHDLAQASEWAQQDAALTHPHKVCLQANALYAMAIAYANSGKDSREIYKKAQTWAAKMKVEAPLMETIVDACTSPPADYISQQRWVLIAFQNALWHLLHAASLEEGVVDTVIDTNAAIAGALLGAVYGVDAVPAQWRDKVLSCRPETGRHVRHPRPECFWPADALQIAQCLVAGGQV